MSASTWLLPTVLSFVTTPTLIGALGREVYGLYALVMGFVGYSFAFGIGKAAAKYVAEYRALGDHRSVNEAISATFRLSLGIGIAGSIAIALFADLLVKRILNVDGALAEEAHKSLIIAGAIVLATMVSQVWSFALQGLHRFDRFAIITGFGYLVTTSGLLIFALLGAGIVSLLFWTLASTTTVSTLFYFAVRRADTKVRLVGSIRPEISRSIRRYAGAIVLSQIFGNLLLLFERAWITRNFGVESLTFYVVPMTLALFLHAFVGSVVIVIFPVINERLSERGRVLLIHRISTKLVLAIAALALVSSAALAHNILSLWVGDAIADRSSWLLVIHMGTFGLLAMITVAWHVAESFGSARITVVFSLAWLLISFALMLVFRDRYGLEGVAVARLLGSLAAIPFLIFVENRILGGFSASQWAYTLLRLSVAIGVAYSVQRVVASWTGGYAAVAIGLAVGSVAYVGVLLITGYFSRDEITWFLNSFTRTAQIEK